MKGSERKERNLARRFFSSAVLYFCFNTGNIKHEGDGLIEKPTLGGVVIAEDVLDSTPTQHTDCNASSMNSF